MSGSKKQKKKKPEELQMENEILKAKMILEHGAVFGGTDLDPARENTFLKNVEMFEAAFMSPEETTVYEYIGKPRFRKADQISDARIGKSLERLLIIMNENGVSLDTICPVDDRTLYRFITEELFKNEMDNVKIPGMMNCFIYEEFHPNHEHDIREHSEEFIRDFLRKGEDWYKHVLSRKAEKNCWFGDFRNAYSEISPATFEIRTIEFSKKRASLDFRINFNARPEDGQNMHIFDGKGSMKLVYEYDYWSVDAVKFPPKTDG